MRFLFVTPRPFAVERPSQHWLPVGFPYIGAALKQAGHEVAVFDRYARMADLGTDSAALDLAMLEMVRKWKPEVVGLGTVTPLIADTARCASVLRRDFSGVLVAGGHHATALPGLTLERIPELDHVVQGEGELVLTRLAAGQPAVSIPGLWSRSPSGIGGLPPEQIACLDELPFPDLSLFDMQFYTRRGTNMIRGHFLSTTSLLTSRGCSRRCSFCTESLTYGAGVRFHSAAYVADMVEAVLGRYPQIEAIYFHDNDFMIDRSRVESICREFLRRSLQRRFGWAVQARVDRLDRDILRLMRQAGCIALELGVEASSQAMLDQFGKGSTVDQNLAAIRLCQAQGISVHAYMLTQVAGETLADLELRLRWLKQANPTSFSWSPLRLYPGSRMYHDRGENGFFETNPWTEPAVRQYFDTDYCSDLDPQIRRQWMAKTYEPFQKRYHRLNQLKVNSCLKWPSIAVAFLKRSLARWRTGA
jgi:radical SAM superfamily enzyme YgiQ (UPF0313 family)